MRKTCFGNHMHKTGRWDWPGSGLALQFFGVDDFGVDCCSCLKKRSTCNANKITSFFLLLMACES